MKTLILQSAENTYSSDAIYAFERALVKAGDECCLRVCNDAPSSSALRDVDTFDLVVASGGDRFITQSLSALRGKEQPICVFPSGAANLFFETLENPAEPAALARACTEGHAIETDLAEVLWIDPDHNKHKQVFSLMSGTGFDAELMKGAIPNKQAMGNAAYFIAALSNPTPEVAEFHITIDGREIVKKGISCIVANTATLVGGIDMVYNCSLVDGMLDCIVLEAPDALGLIRPFIRGLFDRRGAALGRPTIFHAQGQIIDVKISKPMPMQIDGEPLGYEVNRFQGRVLPKQNRVIVSSLSRYAQ